MASVIMPTVIRSFADAATEEVFDGVLASHKDAARADKLR